MSASTAQGIQTLLEAEKEASKVVAKARQCAHHMLLPLNSLPTIDRVQRLKEAKSDAQKEIDALKAQKETEFVAFQGKVGQRLASLC
jgi:V-type H+-transporting ATPase subunit G